jgi:hypothetical protein
MTDDAPHDVERALALGNVFPAALAADAGFRAGLIEAYAALRDGERRGDIGAAVAARWPA